jgi:N-acylneuraminate cytidylyltransferase
MINKYNVLAIIPARGNSKRIPEKNIKILSGKPLIAYSIEEALKSKYIDKVITSTDNEEIATIAKELGSMVPFLRPKELAGDNVTDYPVICHAVEWMENNSSFHADIVVQLRPTSPLRTVKEIDEAIELLAKNPKADSVRTVCLPEQSPYKMYSISKGGYLKKLLRITKSGESFNLPNQLLPKAYKHVGYVDAVWYKTLFKKNQMTGTKILPLIIEEAYSGINDPKDWDYYEYLIKRRENNI